MRRGDVADAALFSRRHLSTGRGPGLWRAATLHGGLLAAVTQGRLETVAGATSLGVERRCNAQTTATPSPRRCKLDFLDQGNDIVSPDDSRSCGDRTHDVVVFKARITVEFEFGVFGLCRIVTKRVEDAGLDRRDERVDGGLPGLPGPCQARWISPGCCQRRLDRCLSGGQFAEKLGPHHASLTQPYAG